MFQDPRERPRTIHELCEALNTPLQSLQVQCVYCKKTLEWADVYNFAICDLRIVYRNDSAYGACKKCIIFYSKIIEYRRYTSSVYGATLEARTKRSLCTLLIRCHRCQIPLGPEEKQRIVDEKRRFHEIAGYWKGLCTNCWRPRREATETQV
uniref:Protein E6 n=1 Tax=Human papillomavirus 69 TaxID=37121 RepID=A0A0P0EGE6_HPV69|nr:early protein E6 [human papillomavirus 69]ALJ32829.1 early protein E6 [human papillomavirus 69]